MRPEDPVRFRHIADAVNSAKRSNTAVEAAPALLAHIQSLLD